MVCAHSTDISKFIMLIKLYLCAALLASVMLLIDPHVACSRCIGLIRENSRPKNTPKAEPIIFTPESTADSMSNPPLKKRRAKRTEEERIEYLRTDPYVAQYEPYRVLCASCNKWIRLRPNSTYCSIPWDAHRKSCLSKKA